MDKTVLEGRGVHEVVATLTVDGYVAKGVDLRVNCRASDGHSVCNGLDYDPEDPSSSPPWYRNALVSREDGTLVSSPSRTIYLGELAAGETQEVKLYVYYAGDDDNARITLTASAWNVGTGGAASVLLRRSGSDAPMPPEPEVPSHNSFLDSQGSGGSVGFGANQLGSCDFGGGRVRVDSGPRATFLRPTTPSRIYLVRLDSVRDQIRGVSNRTARWPGGSAAD